MFKDKPHNRNKKSVTYIYIDSPIIPNITKFIHYRNVGLGTRIGFNRRARFCWRVNSIKFSISAPISPRDLLRCINLHRKC